MGARVLVVDDDPWILRMVTATLQKRDYVVDTAREGRQALQRASANPPDVIISDVMMPVMDGWTFVEQLRRDPRLSSIPVIFLTALGKDEARIAELGLSPDDFLAKPFRFDALEKRVAAALAKPTRAPAQPQPQPHPQAGMPAHPNAQPPGSPSAPGTYGGHPPAAQHQSYTSPGAYGAAAAPAQAAPQAPAARPQAEEPPVVGFAPDFPARHVDPEAQEPLRAPPKTAEVRAAASGTEPRRTRRTTALNGRLEQLQLSSLLVMMEMERKDGLLALKDSRTGIVGRVFLRRGQVICAKLGDTDTGKECVYDMLNWKAGTFSFNAMEVEMEDTINSSTTHLLMEGARLIDEANREEGF
ncbi:MAG: response regulator [Nannocystaceae bacterium]|nr:response regulator [Nannocystaceae bacterium]